ncbi:MAG: hypothetical protein Q8Q44_01065, partial [Nocardioides sp.]|nr:hypothetical protein [Nocardioides sp.]
VQRRGEVEPESMTGFARTYPAVYLGAMVVFWLGALPAFLDAQDGVTGAGTPVGSGWYTMLCFVGAVGVLVALLTVGRRTPVRTPSPHTAH